MIKFTEIIDITDHRIELALNIYEVSFPENEKQSISIIKNRMKKNISRMFIGEIEKEVVLMSLVFILKKSEFILLDYMAVHPNYKGQGVGSSFLQFITKKLLDENKYFVLEVENPNYGEDNLEKKKRVSFYQKNGVMKLKDVNYILPPLNGSKPTEMILMILPNYGNGVIEGDKVKILIKLIYQEVYNRDKEDIFLSSFINTIPLEVELI